MAIDWALEYPIVFATNGDTTAEAIGKNIEEVKKVYEHLNELNESITSNALIQPTDYEITVSLPEGRIVVASGEDSFTMARANGTVRDEILVEDTYVAASETAYGTAWMGEIVTEEDLYNALVDGSSGTPEGAIIIWSKGADTVPTGWAVCDGENGTPDLRGLFVRGAYSGETPEVAGSDEAEVQSLNVPDHKHSFEFTGAVEAHTHDVAITLGSHAFAHGHSSGRVQFYTGNAGSHRHDYDGYARRSGTSRQPYQGGSGLDKTLAVFSRYGLYTSGGHGHGTANAYSTGVTNSGYSHSHTVTGTMSESEAVSIDLGGYSNEVGVEAEAQKISLVPEYYEVIYIQKMPLQEVA